MEPEDELLKFLLSREISSGGLSKLSTKYVRRILATQNQRRQKMSTLFPALGSKFNTVILGFTPCGDYLVTLDHTSVRFHLASLSADGIKIQHMHYCLRQNVNLTAVDGLPWWTSPIEILMSSKTIQYVATLFFTRYYDRCYDDFMEDMAALCDLRLFSSGKLLMSISVSAVVNQSFLFAVSTARMKEKIILYVNNGNNVSFYLFGEKGCEAEYNDIIEGTEDGELPSELLDSKTFYHRYSGEDNWFSCNMVGSEDSCKSPDGMSCPPSVPQSKFKVEKFLRNTLLPFYYPGLDVLKSLTAFEIRCLGSGERGSYILMVISAVINPYRGIGNKFGNLAAEGKEIAYLVTLHPFLGDVTVLKMRDLGQFYESQNSRTNVRNRKLSGDCDQNGTISGNPGIRPDRKLDFYCLQLLQSDPFLRDFSSSASTLSSLEAVSGTLRAISHPFLPIVIYKDE